MHTGRSRFEQATDFSVGLEEEFAILDSDLELTPGFDVLHSAASADPVLAASVAGELISSEIEIRSGRGEDLGDALAAQANTAAGSFALRRARAFSSERAEPTRGPTTGHSRSSTPSTITECRRGSNTSRGVTTPSRCTFTWASEAPIAQFWCVTACGRCCHRCWQSRRARRFSTDATPACTALAVRSSRAASRVVGSRMRSEVGAHSPSTSSS